ncbi:hypothetical protein C8Q80DRAFT_255318 [Daedaleopsis nitida]|nr:hypothetical protein C8Q80DRAFT_255318 [Daedaleopsis nitida]
MLHLLEDSEESMQRDAEPLSFRQNQDTFKTAEVRPSIPSDTHSTRHVPDESLATQCESNVAVSGSAKSCHATNREDTGEQFAHSISWARAVTTNTMRCVEHEDRGRLRGAWYFMDSDWLGASRGPPPDRVPAIARLCRLFVVSMGRPILVEDVEPRAVTRGRSVVVATDFRRTSFPSASDLADPSKIPHCPYAWKAYVCLVQIEVDWT